jgi:Na+/serine symporter
MDTLLKNRILHTLSDHSLAIPEINAIYGFLHNYTNCLVRITNILEDIIQDNIIHLSDIPNIILLLATIFQEEMTNSGEHTDPEIIYLLIKITAVCILDMNPNTKIYVVDLPENQNEMVVDNMINSCLELLVMKPISSPFSSLSKKNYCYWFF